MESQENVNRFKVGLQIKMITFVKNVMFFYVHVWGKLFSYVVCVCVGGWVKCETGKSFCALMGGVRRNTYILLPVTSSVLPQTPQ